MPTGAYVFTKLESLWIFKSFLQHVTQRSYRLAYHKDHSLHLF